MQATLSRLWETQWDKQLISPTNKLEGEKRGTTHKDILNVCQSNWTYGLHLNPDLNKSLTEKKKTRQLEESEHHLMLYWENGHFLIWSLYLLWFTEAVAVCPYLFETHTKIFMEEIKEYLGLLKKKIKEIEIKTRLAKADLLNLGDRYMEAPTVLPACAFV